MMEYKTEEYFPTEFNKDVEQYLKIGSCYCNKPIMTISRDSEKLKEFKSPVDFFIVLYELTLLSEVVYTYFNEYHEKFFKLFPVFPSNKCGPIASSQNIIHFATNSNTGIIFDKSNILKWDKFFIEYLKDIFKNNDFGDLTLDSITEKIKNDQDCIITAQRLNRLL